MISYTTNVRQAPYAPGLHPLALFLAGLDTAGNQTRLRFAERKPITFVPMNYCLNGPANQVLGHGIYTDGMGDCEAIVVLAYDQNTHLAHIGFTHVMSGDPRQVNWGHLMTAIPNYPQVYAIIATSRMARDGALSGDLLYQHIRNNQLIPDANILIYSYGAAHAHPGKTFGINGLHEVGEVDSSIFVSRNTGPRINAGLANNGIVLKNPGHTYNNTDWAKKIRS